MDRWWTETQCTYPRQEPFGSPKFLALLSTHATLFVDPGRPSESSPIRSLCVGFWYRYTIATCIILSNEAVSRLQGVRSPMWPMWFPVYASAVSFGSLTSSTTATLGTGGWLNLARQGLSPCKKRQASWRITALSSAAPLGSSLSFQESHTRTITCTSWRPRGRLQRIGILENFPILTQVNLDASPRPIAMEYLLEFLPGFRI